MSLSKKSSKTHSVQQWVKNVFTSSKDTNSSKNRTQISNQTQESPMYKSLHDHPNVQPNLTSPNNGASNSQIEERLIKNNRWRFVFKIFKLKIHLSSFSMRDDWNHKVYVNLGEENILGKGAFGIVYSGTYLRFREPIEIAAKTLLENDKKDVEEFFKQVFVRSCCVCLPSTYSTIK